MNQVINLSQLKLMQRVRCPGSARPLCAQIAPIVPARGVAKQRASFTRPTVALNADHGTAFLLQHFSPFFFPPGPTWVGAPGAPRFRAHRAVSPGRRAESSPAAGERSAAETSPCEVSARSPRRSLRAFLRKTAPKGARKGWFSPRDPPRRSPNAGKSAQSACGTSVTLLRTKRNL